MSKTNIKHITDLNSYSLRGLGFYKQELGFMQQRLEEIARDNTGQETCEGIEHFQNQFIIHQNYIDELKHLINSNNKNIELQLVPSDVFVEEEAATKHQNLNDQYLTEEKLFNDVRHEFNRFAAKWM